MTGAKRTWLLLAVALAVLMLPAAAAGLGFAPATEGIRSRLLDEFPTATRIFINCPGNNRVAAGIVCETRFIYRGKVRIAEGIAEPDSDRWQSATWSSPGLIVDRPTYRHWQSCPVRGIARHDQAAYPVRLGVFAISCADAHYIAAEMLAYAHYHSLRLPHYFSYERHTHENLGFILKRYGCRSKVQIRQGNPNPYGHETARCSNRFHDRFVFVWDQGS